MPNMYQQRQRGFIFAILAAVLFSLKTIFIKKAYLYGVDTITFLTLRMAFASPFYALVLATATKSKTDAPRSPFVYIKVAGLGLCSYYLASILDLEGLHHISANLERMILYVYPTIVVALGAVFLRRSITGRQALAIGISYFGVVLVFFEDLSLTSHSSTLPLVGNPLTPMVYGAGCVVLSAIAYAVFVVFSEGSILQIGAKRFTALAMLSAAAGIAVHFSLSPSHSLVLLLNQTRAVYGYGLVVAFMCTVVPSFMLVSAIGTIGASNTGVVGMSGPVFTLLVAAITLDEPITPYHILGMTLILGSIFMLRRARKNSAE